MKPRPDPKTRSAQSEASFEETQPLDLRPPEAGALVHHPDGWYWLADSGRQQFGPFASAEEAAAAMTAAGEDGLEPGETLAEAEQELGLADWLDPDTGELAEGTLTRLEDH
jgi:hypothetical protein